MQMIMFMTNISMFGGALLISDNYIFWEKF